MGLDHWIERRLPVGDHKKELICCWRKEPAIHDWFERLAENKGIEFESFNCVPVRIKKKDIEQLIKDIINDNLDYGRTGFLFGSNIMEPNELNEWKQDRIYELEELLQTMKDGKDYAYKYYYNSWW